LRNFPAPYAKAVLDANRRELIERRRSRHPKTKPSRKV
jgi:hypothetical protein